MAKNDLLDDDRAGSGGRRGLVNAIISFFSNTSNADIYKSVSVGIGRCICEDDAARRWLRGHGRMKPGIYNRRNYFLGEQGCHARAPLIRNRAIQFVVASKTSRLLRY
jgi:hypothetical protein